MMRPVLLAVVWLSFGALAQGAEAGTIHFNQAIRPILSDNCFACHGPDSNKRKGKLRLDVREEAISRKAIVPGDPEASELIHRIFAKDPDDLMPPAETHKTLSPSQKETLRQWIAEGAKYEGHWAYIPPMRPEAPVRGAIDFLIEERAIARFGPFTAGRCPNARPAAVF